MTEPAPTVALVERLLVGLVSSQIYGPSSPRVLEASTDAASKVALICRERTSRSVVVGAVGSQVVVDGRPLLGASLFAKRLVARVQDRGSGGIELAAGVSGDDIGVLLELLARRGGPATHQTANEELSGKGVASIRLLPPYESGRTDDGGVLESGPEDADAANTSGNQLALHQGVVDLLQGATICVCQGRDLDLAQVGSTVESLVGQMATDPGALYKLAHYPEHDFFTFGHSIRVGLLAIDVARTMSDDHDLILRVGTAALLHDVGKALIPWDVLHKRGKLDADERREMQRHPALGAGILIATRTSDPLSVAAAYGHHRCAGGGGYPRSCSESEQGMVTDLVKVCDVYEALTASRPYKPPMSPERAFRVMFEMRGQFEPTVLAHFVRTVGIYPAGTDVHLDDGSMARVVRQSGDFHRPVVEVVSASDGSPAEPEDRLPVDLRTVATSGSRLGGASRVVGAVKSDVQATALV